MRKKPQSIRRQEKPKIHLIELGKKLTRLEAKREEIFRYYRDRCDQFITCVSIKDGRREEEQRNLEDEKKYFYYQDIHHILPKNLIKILHDGTLKILAFSDYRVHDIDTLINFVDNLKDKPDIIIYAGDDIRRFSPTPLEFLKISATDKEYPAEIEAATLSSPERSGWVSSSEYGLILRLPRGAIIKEYVQERLSLMLKVTNRIYETLKNPDIQSDGNHIIG